MSAITIARVNYGTARLVYGIAVDRDYDSRVVEFLRDAVLKAEAELKAVEAPSPTQMILEAFGIVPSKRETLLPVSTPLPN
jgi:hypothetical protein